MTDTLDTRRRRAVWRAHHRGTKELDIMIGRFADAHLDDMSAAELSRFEDFMELSEPELQRCLLAAQAACDEPFADLINAVRAFNGIGGAVHVRPGSAD